jgi:hypothetical protein
MTMASPEAFRGRRQYAMTMIEEADIPEGRPSEEKAYLAAFCRRGPNCFQGRPNFFFELTIPSGMPRDMVLDAVKRSISGDHANCGGMSVTEVGKGKKG